MQISLTSGEVSAHASRACRITVCVDLRAVSVAKSTKSVMISGAFPVFFSVRVTERAAPVRNSAMSLRDAFVSMSSGFGLKIDPTRRKSNLSSGGEG